MTTTPCFSSSLPCTKRPRQSSFMLAFGWKVLSTLDTRPPHLTCLSLLAPLLKGRNRSRKPARCWTWLGLRLLSLVVQLSCRVFVLFCKNAFFWSPYIYAKSFFFTSRRVLVIWWHERVDEKKTKSKKHHTFHPIHFQFEKLYYYFCTTLFQSLLETCTVNFMSPSAGLTDFGHLLFFYIFSTCILFTMLLSICGYVFCFVVGLFYFWYCVVPCCCEYGLLSNGKCLVWHADSFLHFQNLFKNQLFALKL